MSSDGLISLLCIYLSTVGSISLTFLSLNLCLILRNKILLSTEIRYMVKKFIDATFPCTSIKFCDNDVSDLAAADEKARAKRFFYYDECKVLLLFFCPCSDRFLNRTDLFCRTINNTICIKKIYNTSYSHQFATGKLRRTVKSSSQAATQCRCNLYWSLK